MTDVSGNIVRYGAYDATWRPSWPPPEWTTFVPTVWTLEVPVTDKELETLDTLVKALAELDKLIEEDEDGVFERISEYLYGRTGYKLTY